MEDKPLTQLIEEKLQQGDVDLPILRSVALELQPILSDNDYSIKDVVDIILKDQTLASGILKMANSSFYAGLKTIKTIQDAVVRLGAKSVSNLVTVITQRQVYVSESAEINRLMESLWRHALGTALSVRWLAIRLGFDRLSEEGFLAGLLHDVGKLFLLKVIEDLQKSQGSLQDIPAKLVDDVLETMHCVQGERLMKQFNMPEEYCRVVAMHHNKIVAGDDIVLNLVRLANLTCHKLGIGLHHDPGLMLSTSQEAVSLMVSDMMLAELQVQVEAQMLEMQDTPGT
jgi:HD-like signal output (HDOD) protein